MTYNKTRSIFIFVILWGVLLASCSFEKSPDNQMSLEFPTTSFSIDPTADTTIFGKLGTRIFIGADVFQFADGSPANTAVKIEVQEIYNQADMILADLSTTSNDQVLESQGMLNISANSDGKKIEIKPGKRIVVHFPKEKFDYRKMDLFYPDQTVSSDSSVGNWKVDTVDLVKKTLKIGGYGWWYPDPENGDSTSYNFQPKDFKSEKYYFNPLDMHLNAFNFSEETKKEIGTKLNKNTYPHFESWNDYGVECEVSITKSGYIKNPKIVTRISKSARKEIYQFLLDIPQLEPGRNMYGDIIERRGLLFIQAGQSIPLFKTDEAYVKSFDSKYAQYEQEPIRNMDEAEFNFYVFSVSKLGWINCDRFLEFKNKVDFWVESPIAPTTDIKMVFSDIKGVLKANFKEGKYVFSNVPLGKEVTIIGIQNVNGTIQSAFQKAKISTQPLPALKFEETTLSELRKALLFI